MAQAYAMRIVSSLVIHYDLVIFQSGFDSLKEELGPSRESTLPRQEAISEKDDHDVDADDDEAEDEGDKLAAEEKITEKMSFRHQQQFETGKKFQTS